MKKVLIAMCGFLPFIALAHGGAAMEEELGLGHQMEELLPFMHYSEGHYFAMVFIVVLWAAFIYALYSLIKKFFLKDTV